MEHFKSTLATTGLATVSLFLAAHWLNPAMPELEQPRPVRAITAAQPAPQSVSVSGPITAEAAPIAAPEADARTAWVDPPVRAEPDADAQAGQQATAREEEARKLEEARLEQEKAEQQAKSEQAKTEQAKIEQVRKRKLAQAKARERAATAARKADAARVAAGESNTAAPASEPAPKADPIGTLLYGLGLGGRRQG